MVEIKSYFLVNGEFVLSNECEAPLTGTIDIASEDVEGALEFNVNGTALIDKSMNDFVDELWVVLLTGLAHVIKKRNSRGHFPDQGIEVMFLYCNDDETEIRVTVNETVKAYANTKELLNVLLTEADNFFVNLKRNCPKGDYSFQLGLVEAIRNKDFNYLEKEIGLD